MVTICKLRETTHFVDGGKFSPFFPWPCALVARILQSPSKNTAIYERAVFPQKVSLLASVCLDPSPAFVPTCQRAVGYFAY